MPVVVDDLFMSEASLSGRCLCLALPILSPCHFSPGFGQRLHPYAHSTLKVTPGIYPGNVSLTVYISSFSMTSSPLHDVRLQLPDALLIVGVNPHHKPYISVDNVAFTAILLLHTVSFFCFRFANVFSPHLPRSTRSASQVVVMCSCS